MASPPRATLADIAAAAGVSVSTVSRALRGRGEMTSATRARIVSTARALGHTRGSGRPGRPRQGTSMLFDLVLGQFHDPYADEVTAGAHTGASALRYDLVLTSERDTLDDDWPMRIRSRGSAGVVLGLIIRTTAQLAVLREADIPLVLLDPRADPSLPVTSVRTTDLEGAAEAAAHLISRGARRFVVVGGAPSYRFGRARLDGFESTIRAELPSAPLVRVNAGWTASHARRVCRQALTDLPDDGPIGLFACSDEMAAGAYRAVADVGMRIPDDVLVVGFDDVRGARWLHPSLTTVRQPIREMAAAAIYTLAAEQGSAREHRVIELPTTLIPRGSTRAAGTARA